MRAGVCGVRFSFVQRLVDFTRQDELMEIAARIVTAGLACGRSISRLRICAELWDFFTALPTTVVVDRTGRPDVSLPVDGTAV